VGNPLGEVSWVATQAPFGLMSPNYTVTFWPFGPQTHNYKRPKSDGLRTKVLRRDQIRGLSLRTWAIESLCNR